MATNHDRWRTEAADWARTTDPMGDGAAGDPPRDYLYKRLSEIAAMLRILTTPEVQEGD